MAVSLFVVYLMTMAPGLTWANQGSDGGDLVTSAAVGGVAHPTGYPVYLFLARLFQLLPIGSLAFRTNLLSAFASVCAAIFIYALVIQSLPPTTRTKYAGLTSAFAFGLAPLVWSQSVITEVYALHALSVTVILYLASDQAAFYFPQKRLDVLIGLAFGLGMGNHITTILLFPVFILPTFFHADSVPSTAKWRLDTQSLFRRLLWMGMGLLAYLSLPLRALSQPKVNWGNPVTLDGFFWLVSGKLYQEQFFGLTLDLGLLRARAAAGMLIEQFGILGLVIGLIGLFVFYKPSRLYINTIWTVSIFTFFAIGYSTTDSYMYLIPAFSCFAIWIGLGVSGLMNMFHQRFRKFESGISLVVILFLFLQAGNHWASVDASKDLRAEQFGKDVLLRAPENAVIFAKGDKAIFAMWYFHYALQGRPDIAVVATDLLHFDWYQKSLHENYPRLNLPGAYPFASTVIAANPERPICYVEYIQKAEISCEHEKSP
ncbi:MAG: DUF2723 domain-containing protein [Anaerolineales bacterium]|nr:DUF2723 domain-containing protein [Anaerolineales bacterium]